jgi:hypothetical protein
MIRAAKKFAKSLPFPSFLRLFYIFYFLFTLPKLSRAARSNGIKSFSELDLRELKRSEALFILGNGPSINQITESRWRAIQSRDTMACNFWLYHHFIPKFYFFELIDSGASPTVYREFLRVANRRAHDYRNVVKVVTEVHRERLSMLHELSDEWRENIYTFSPVPLAARTEAEFVYALAYLRQKGIFQSRHRIQYLFKYGTTLTALVGLAARMEYKQIVLCGVDLGTAHYFYNDRRFYPEVRPDSRGAVAGRFYAMTDIPWMVKIDAVLNSLRKQVLEPAGIELYVENRSSALWPEIPEAPQELFAHTGQPVGC